MGSSLGSFEGNLEDDQIALNFAADLGERPVEIEQTDEIPVIAKVTKEDMQFTPVPIFDCIYCVRGKEFEVLNQTSVDKITAVAKKQDQMMVQDLNTKRAIELQQVELINKFATESLPDLE